MSDSTAYEAAGVSIEAGDRAVELMKGWVEKARRPEMIGGIGGFAGLFDASALKATSAPLLATSADGVGTKVAIAQALDKHDTIGFDLVGMLVDDLVVCGAEPLFLTDYIATGRVVPERIAAIVKGIAEACVEAGCALIGGETAEHPGLLGPDEYDVAGSTTGVVEAADLLGPGRVRPGDAVHRDGGLSGLHSNGYSLVRHVLLGSADRRRRLVAGPARRRARPDPGRGAARADPDLRQGLPRAGRRHRRPTPWRTSPAAGWPPTSTGCCPSSSRPPWTARPGPRSRSSTWSGGSARSPSPTSSRPSTAGSAWSRWSTPDDADRALAVLAGHGVQAWVAGRGHRGRGRRRAGGSRWWDSTPVGEFGRRNRVAVCGNSHPAGSVVLTKETNRSGLARR